MSGLIAKISFKNESDWHENNKIIFLIKASNLASLLNRRLGQLGNGLITKNFLKQLSAGIQCLKKDKK